MVDANAPRTPIPWAASHAQHTQSVFGPDPWPYGIEPNRTTIEAFLEYAVEQGVCERSLTPEELFAPQVREFFRV
jgi:4,5-dihydroxyphthalate decarboxylase